MIFLRAIEGAFELQFASEEKALLFHLLNFYPLVPETYHRLTRDKQLARRQEDQQMLDDALKSQREQNKKEIIAFISNAARFSEVDGESKIVFTRNEVEWLLQVFNDVRVGCWIALGSPGYEAKKKLRPDQTSLQHTMMMEIAGAFEMFFLGLINGDVPPENEE